MLFFMVFAILNANIDAVSYTHLDVYKRQLYSIVQMPSGIPVATVAINGGANAGILAAKILATSDEALLGRLKEYSESLKNDVVRKAEKLESIGYKEYLAQMK